MSLLSRLSTPFKFVENEFESVVNSLYNLYHRRTGGSQYYLSNFYFAGGALYNVTAVYLSANDPIETLASAMSNGMVLYILSNANERLRKLEETLNKEAEAIKHLYIEEWKIVARLFGRINIFLSGDILLDRLTGYSVIGHLYTGGVFAQTYIFNLVSTTLMAFGAYTAAIDTNNPKKSKIMESARNFILYITPKIPKKVPIRIPD